MWDDKSKWRSSREGFGEALVELGHKHDDVVVLTCDLSESTRAAAFQKEFPNRFYQFGIAEQNMMCAATGMSLVGLTPFVCTYGVFSAGRCWEQLRLSVCYSNCNVKIEGAHAGLLVGPDGASHQATEDLTITRVIPNLTVICPCDSIEAKKATIAAYEVDGPVYIRVGREPLPVITDESKPFKIGEATLYGDKGDVVIIACGSEIHHALLAQYELKRKGTSALVINCSTLKPLDESIAEMANYCGAVVVAEEHQVNGGLGGAVAELLSQTYPVPMEFVAIRDKFGQSGRPMELIKRYNLMKDDIVEASYRAIDRKANK